MKLKPTLSKNKHNKPTLGHKKLKLLITVVNRQKAEFFADLLQGHEVNCQTMV